MFNDLYADSGTVKRIVYESPSQGVVEGLDNTRREVIPVDYMNGFRGHVVRWSGTYPKWFKTAGLPVNYRKGWYVKDGEKFFICKQDHVSPGIVPSLDTLNFEAVELPQDDFRITGYWKRYGQPYVERELKVKLYNNGICSIE